MRERPRERRRLWGGLLLATSAAAIAAAAWAQAPRIGAPGPDDGLETQLTARPVGTPTASARRAGLRATTGAALIQYRQTTPVTVPAPTPSTAGAWGLTIGSCPRRLRVVSGYYFRDEAAGGFGLADEGGSPLGPRRWSFYVRNNTAEPIAEVVFGLVCARARGSIEPRLSAGS